MNKKKFGIILPITLLAYFLILMDNSIIFTSSIQIAKSLTLSSSELSWVSSAYTLSFGGFLLLSGRLSDIWGKKRVFLIGLSIFGITSLSIGFSQNASMIIGMRVLQGIGSSIIAPTSLALIMDTYKNDMRQKAISYYGATAGIGSSIGLLVGGGLTSFISWRAGFFINVPFTLILIFLTSKYVNNSSETRKDKIDYLGSLLSILGLIGTIYGFTEGKLLIIMSGIIILFLFIFREQRIKFPILPLILFKNKTRASAYIIRLLFMMTMLPFWFFIPQMLQSQYGFSVLESGMAFLPLTIVNFIIALRLPQLTTKFGNTRILFIGEVILAIGLILVACANINSGYWYALFIPMMIIGLGQGLILAPVTSAGVHEAPTELSGIASSLTNVMHQIGGPIGLSIIVVSTSNFQMKIWIMVVFTLSALIVVAFLIIGDKSES
ncbi:MFS transporter [Carnobacterium maltaromaticum]|uniref:MFS transporter n=1 Tax=Carnobacterium maltaromaticum TaxID=2751 RepID=UPI0012F95540|nr:MFS transporter [Carnobacterium maltaromaticum]